MKSVHDVASYAVLGIVFVMTLRAWPADTQAVHVVETAGQRSPAEHLSAAEPRVVTVTGTADMLIPPDEISVNISYREYWTKGETAHKISIDSIEDKIVKAAKKAGIPATSISIESIGAWKYNWNYWHYWYGSNQPISQKNLTIQLSTTSQLQEIIDDLKARSVQKEGIVGITLGTSSHSKIQDYRKLVKTRALRAAQDKASYLMESVGETSSRLLRVTELQDPQTSATTTQSYYGSPYYYGWGGFGGGSYASQSQTNLGVSNATVSVPYNPGSQADSGASDLAMKPIRLQYAIEATFEIDRPG